MKRGTGTLLALLSATALVAGCATNPSVSAPNVTTSGTAPGTTNVVSGAHNPDFAGGYVYHVTYRFNVAPDGSVHDPVVTDRDSIPLMVLATRQALLRSKFAPCANDDGCSQLYTFRYVIPKVEFTAHNP